MASIAKDPKGYRILFEVKVPGQRSRERKTIYLPASMKLKQVELFRDSVADLLHANAHGQTPTEATTRWLHRLDDRTHAKLARVGIVQTRSITPPTSKAMTLGKFLADFFAAVDVKPATILAYGHVRRYLLAYFGESRQLNSITPQNAAEWRMYLRTLKREKNGTDRKLSDATVNRRTTMARQFFNQAVDWELIDRNPFAKVKGGHQRNPERQFFITRPMADAVLAECDDPQWKLLFALSRFGGMRCPSEHLALTWDCIDWDKQSVAKGDWLRANPHPRY